MTSTTIGTGRPVISLMRAAIASACPRSSAAGPGNAPAVSRNVTTGMPSLSARRSRRWRLPEALRVRRAEVAEDVRVGVGALLMPDDHHRPPVEQRRPAHDGRVVAEGAIAGQLGEVGEDAPHEVERARPLRMARELDARPRGLRLVSRGRRGRDPLCHGADGLVDGHGSSPGLERPPTRRRPCGLLAVAPGLAVVDPDRLADRAAEPLGEARTGRRSGPTDARLADRVAARRPTGSRRRSRASVARSSGRATTRSTKPCSRRNSEVWKPSGSSSPTVPVATRAPAKPMSALGLGDDHVAERWRSSPGRRRWSDRSGR